MKKGAIILFTCLVHVCGSSSPTGGGKLQVDQRKTDGMLRSCIEFSWKAK